MLHPIRTFGTLSSKADNIVISGSRKHFVLGPSALCCLPEFCEETGHFSGLGCGPTAQHGNVTNPSRRERKGIIA
jgi:hypothetical protein